MSTLPPEIVTDDILTRLPVKSLLRFRCVSKSWCSLISSSRFIKSHLAKSIETMSHRKLMLQEQKIYSTDLDSPDIAVELDHHLKCSNFGTLVQGSCNGLILLCNSDFDSIPSNLPKDMPNISPFYENLYHMDEFSIIWNPSTGRHQPLFYSRTEYPFNYSRPQYIQYGFGYDSASDDYKVVKIMQFLGVAAPGYYNSVVKIFSLKLKKWKTIEKCPYYLAYDNAYGVFAGGALHWVMRAKCESEPDFFVGAVDLATERHRAVPLPEFGDVKFHMNVGTLGENLCIFCHCPSYGRLDVWIMNEYGVKESWTKAFSYWQPKDINGYKYVRPLAFSKSGREVLLVHENRKLSWYDLEGKVCKDIDLRGLTTEFNSMGYVQSLVQLPHEKKMTPMKKTEEKGEDKQGEEKKEERKQDKKEKNIVKKRDNFLSKGFKLKL